MKEAVSMYFQKATICPLRWGCAPVATALYMIDDGIKIGGGLLQSGRKEASAKVALALAQRKKN